MTTITTNLLIVSTSLNSSMPTGSTTAVETLVVNYGQVPTAGMPAFATGSISVPSPSSSDLSAYAVGNELVQTIAPAPSSSTSSSSSSSSSTPSSSSSSTAAPASSSGGSSSTAS